MSVKTSSKFKDFIIFESIEVIRSFFSPVTILMRYLSRKKNTRLLVLILGSGLFIFSIDSLLVDSLRIQPNIKSVSTENKSSGMEFYSSPSESANRIDSSNAVDALRELRINQDYPIMISTKIDEKKSQLEISPKFEADVNSGEYSGPLNDELLSKFDTANTSLKNGVSKVSISALQIVSQIDIKDNLKLEPPSQAFIQAGLGISGSNSVVSNFISRVADEQNDKIKLYNASTSAFKDIKIVKFIDSSFLKEKQPAQYSSLYVKNLPDSAKISKVDILISQ